MRRSLSGYGRRPPSPSSFPRGHSSLSIRTASQQPQRATPSASFTPPTDNSDPEFPLPIPVEKQEKARKLYRKYLWELKLEQKQSEHSKPYLDVPGRPSSTISRSSSSRKRRASVSASTHDTVTDFASVVSFDGDDALPSKVKGEKLAFDGSSVKGPRTRRQFTPVRKAKTALIRCLGSCKKCRPRKVPCDLKHYDLISLLQPVLTSHNQTQLLNNDSISPTTPSHHMNISQGQNDASSSLSQRNALAGIGDKYSSTEQGPIAATLDIQSPDSYGFTRMPEFRSDEFFTRSTTIGLTTSANHTYQNAGMFPLGLFDMVYFCQYLEGDAVCGQFFVNDEELQQHFSISHFPYIRLNPAHRYLCSQCEHLNNDLRSPCYNCGTQGSIQIWLYGSHISTPSFSRHAPDGQNLQQFDPYNTALPPSMPNIWATGMDSYGGSTGTGQFNAQNGSFYGGLGSQSFDFNSSGDAEPEGSQFMGSNYGGARQYASGISRLARLGFFKSRQLITKCTINIVLFSLLAMLTLGFSLRWILHKAEAHYRALSYRFQAQLPILGFMVFLVSFAVSLLVKYLWDKRMRRRRSQYVGVITMSNDSGYSTDRKPRRCPLHSLTDNSQTSKGGRHGFDNRVYIH